MRRILFVLIIGSLTISCQKTKESTASEKQAFSAERNTFFSNLMDPAEVAVQIQSTAAKFNPGVLNDPKNYSIYYSNEVKEAANMGIYLSDLNYCIAYSKSDFSKEYFTAAYELSRAMGVEKTVLEFLMQRYNTNLAQNDSVKNVVTDLLLKSTRGLQGTELEKLAGVAMSAYQIENLHIALGIIESYPKDMLPDDVRMIVLIPLYKVVLKQRNNIATIQNFLKTFSDPLDPNKNPNFPYYSNALSELIGVYDRLKVDEKIANNQGVELLNDVVMKELSEKVNAIRDKIVSVENQQP